MAENRGGDISRKSKAKTDFKINTFFIRTPALLLFFSVF
jgi:hypothetical protein